MAADNGKIKKKLPRRNAVLEKAWERFAVYDKNAGIFQKSFNRLQNGILIFAVVGTFLALAQTQLHLLDIVLPGSAPDRAMQIVIIFVPITVSILMSVANRFKVGNKYIHVRAAAENIKQEIYKYRTGTGTYRSARSQKISADAKLANRIKDVTRKLMQTKVNHAGIKAYKANLPPQYGVANGDDGFSLLTPEKYITFRLLDQQNYFQSKTVKLDKSLKRTQYQILIVGGIGTLLAALGFELWIALTTAIAGSLATFIEFKQIENLLISYNKTSVDLANIHIWWIALGSKAKKNSENINRLVGFTEQVLATENSGWVQQMRDMLDDLQEDQSLESTESSTDD